MVPSYEPPEGPTYLYGASPAHVPEAVALAGLAIGTAGCLRDRTGVGRMTEGGQQDLIDAERRATERANAPVRPPLGSDPRQRVVAIIGVVAAQGERPFRSTPTANILNHSDETLAGELRGNGLLFPTVLSSQDRRQPQASADRSVDVRREADAVPHDDLVAAVNLDPVTRRREDVRAAGVVGRDFACVLWSGRQLRLARSVGLDAQVTTSS